MKIFKTLGFSVTVNVIFKIIFWRGILLIFEKRYRFSEQKEFCGFLMDLYEKNRIYSQIMFVISLFVKCSFKSTENGTLHCSISFSNLEYFVAPCKT